MSYKNILTYHVPLFFAANKCFAREILAKNHIGVHWDKTPDSCSRWSKMYKSNGFISKLGRAPIFDTNELKVMDERGDCKQKTTMTRVNAIDVEVRYQKSGFFFRSNSFHGTYDNF